MTAIPIPANSEEFSIVQFLLQLQLHAPRFKLSECFDLGNDTIKMRFAEYASKMLSANIVDVFIPLSSVKQPVSDIVNRGVKFNPRAGLRFKTNGIDLDTTEDMHEMLHLVVALGQILNFEVYGSPIKEINFNTAEPKPEDLLSRYDTLRINQNNEFVVFNPNQVKACHLLRFRGGDNLARDPPDFDPAILDGETTVLNASLQECPEHPRNIAQYYDRKSHAPVCLECKINGSHSRGEASKHRLVPIIEVYNDKRQELAQPSRAFEKRRKMIKERANGIDERLSMLDEAEMVLVRQINLMAQKAIEQAHRLYDEKAIILHSAKIELERKQHEVEDLEKMIQIHYEHSPPLDMLRAAFASSTLSREIRDPADLPVPPEDLGEIAILQDLEVGIREAQKINSRDSDKQDQNEEEPDSRSGVIPKDKGQSAQYRDPSMGTATVTKGGEHHVTSLAKMARRKMEKYSRQGIEIDFVPFDISSIIATEDLKKMLYCCFPFKATPTTRLLYSSQRDGRSVPIMHQKIDGIGVTAVIVKSGDHIFGGFAASKWNTDGLPFGEKTSSFLFSLDKDAFIPQKPLPDEPICLYADNDSITFGKYDLKLAGNLDQCQSTIENNFGIGLEYGSRDAKSFLAGSPVFKADIVEVWGFFSGSEAK